MTTNNMSAHTPGPWTNTGRISQHDSRLAIVDRDGNYLAIVAHDNPDIEQANAALIASAPDLLAINAKLVVALDGCIRALDGKYPWPIAARFTKKEARQAAIDQARTALQRAEAEAQ